MAIVSGAPCHTSKHIVKAQRTNLTVPCTITDAPTRTTRKPHLAFRQDGRGQRRSRTRLTLPNRRLANEFITRHATSHKHEKPQAR